MDNKTKNTTETKRPGKTNGYSNGKLHAKQNRKRQEAEARQEIYDGLIKEEKLALISKRPGQSKRELARINKNN